MVCLKKMLYTVDQLNSEVGETSENDIQDRKQLIAIIAVHNYMLETLLAYIKKVHSSLSEEATALGIQLNDLPITLDF